MLAEHFSCGRIGELFKNFGILLGALAAFVGATLSLTVTYSAEPTHKVAKALTSDNDGVRLQAIASLHQSPELCDTLLDSLIAISKEEVEKTGPKDMVRPSLAELLTLIGKIENEEGEKLLIEMLKASHFGIVMIATDILGQNKTTNAIKPLTRQIYRPEYQMSYGFRFNLIRALARMDHPDAIEFLSGLRPQLDGQLRFETEKWLSQVVATDFQGDSARFDKWRQDQESKVVLASSDSDSQSRERMRLGKPQQYYGIDIQAKRLMFIIDHSGSMREPVNGTPRLYRAKVELIKAIEQLHSDAEFSILFYATTVQPWRSELVTATIENKREAIRFVERLGYGDMTNTYGALRRSLEFDRELEAVFLLTDGRPTSGDVTAPQAIVADLLHRNRFRHLQFNTIGIALDFPTEQFLRLLSENSGGEFRKTN
jgi:hypothetical protein